MSNLALKSCIVALFLSSPAGVARAEPPAGVQAQLPRVQEVTTIAEGEQLLTRARRAFAEAKTYRDEVRITYRVYSRDQGVLPSDESVSHVRLTLRKPGDYRYERWTGEDRRWSAGGAALAGALTVWVGEWGQYVSASARTPADPEELGARTWGTITFDHPLAPSLLRLDREDLLAGPERVEQVRIESVGDRQCLRIAGSWNGRSLHMTEPASAEIWIDRQTFEVRRFQADVSELFLASMLEAPGLAAAFERATLLVEFERSELNPELTDDAFAFTPPPNMQRMEAFDLARTVPPADPIAAEAPAPEAIIEVTGQGARPGQPAPDFRGDALDGAPFALADLRGRIVVLDFWATWCGPCIAAMPTMRDLATRYSDQGVVFVGVSLDALGAKKAIRDTVAREQLPYRQFHDPRGVVSAAYGVSGIPCVVMIDESGIVRSVHVGFGPREAARLEAELKAVLGRAAK